MNGDAAAGSPALHLRHTPEGLNKAPRAELRRGNEEKIVAEEDEEGVTLEEILIEMIDAQLEIVDAVSSGRPLADGEALKVRLSDLRDLLSDAIDDEED